MKIDFYMSLNKVEPIIRSIRIPHYACCLTFLCACFRWRNRLRTRDRFRIAVVSSDCDVPLLLAPMRIGSDGFARPVGDCDGATYGDFIYLTEDEEALTEALRALCDDLWKKGVRGLRMQHVDSTSPVHLLRCIGTVRRGEPEENVEILCDAVDYDTYFKSLSKSIRQNIRTAYNRMSRDGHSYAFEVYTGEVARDRVKSRKRAVADGGRVYLARQLGHYKSGISRLRGLAYKCYVKHFNFLSADNIVGSSESFVAALRIDGRMAAFAEGYYLKAAGRIEIPRLAISADFLWYSPGMILCNELVRHVFASQKMVIDLSRGNERYKTDMGGVIHYTNSLECLFAGGRS